jgi:serine/threonine-protein kinase HipA
MSYVPVRKLLVYRRYANGYECIVGTLAAGNGNIYFQYNDEYLEKGISHSLSPLKLSFDDSLQLASDRKLFAGLHGAFADSLPDGWGTLLMDRVFGQNGINRYEITALDRLAFIGDRGMGALVYRPASTPPKFNLINLHQLGNEAEDIYEGDKEVVFENVARVGASGGARPKAILYRQGDIWSTLPLQNFSPWLVKFTSSHLPLQHDESLCEAAYLHMAKMAGLRTQEWEIAAGNTPKGQRKWLALRRFDWTPNQRYHMASVCSLLDADYKMPSMDYQNIIKLAMRLTKSPSAGQEVFARAMFNLLSCNQDDHTKNWSFLLSEQGQWQLSPFYDVTFCPLPSRQHMTAFSDRGNRPTKNDIELLGKTATFNDWNSVKNTITKIADSLCQWDTIATNYGVSKQRKSEIQRVLNDIWNENKGLLTTR